MARSQLTRFRRMLQLEKHILRMRAILASYADIRFLDVYTIRRGLTFCSYCSSEQESATRSQMDGIPSDFLRRRVRSRVKVNIPLRERNHDAVFPEPLADHEMQVTYNLKAVHHVRDPRQNLKIQR